MVWYFVFPIFIFLFAYLEYKKKWTGIWIFFILLFFSMFRGEQVGIDTSHYIENVSNGSFLYTYYTFKEGVELGFNDFFFYYINYLIDTAGLSHRLIICYMSIITMVFLFWGGRRYKVNISLLLMFYVLMTAYLLSLNIARQMAAVSIVFFGSSFLIEKGNKKHFFWLCILFAALTHASSLVCALLYPLRYLSLKRNETGYIVFAFALLGIFLPLSSFVFNIFGNIPILSSYYEDYGAGSSHKLMEVGIVGVIYKVLLLFFSFMIYQDNRKKEERTDLFDNLFLFSILINGLFASEAGLATTRIRYYFLMFQILYFAQYFLDVRSKRNKKFSLFALFAFQMVLIASISLGYKPYSLDFAF